MTEATPAEAAPRRSLGGIIVPLLLIAIGVVLLLANLGYVPPISIRAIIQLWPLVLVLIGIEILLARRQPLAALALQLLTIVLGVALVSAQPAGLFAPAGAVTSAESVPREGATSLDLTLNGGAGDFTVAGDAASLVDVTATGGAILVRTERRDGRAEIGIDPEHEHFPFGGTGTDIDVRVAGDVPLTLHVEAGAGDLRIDLRGLRVREAEVEAGAGDIVVVLPEPQGDVPVRVNVGAAEVVIEVPAGVEARVTVSGGAVSLDSDNARLPASGGVAQTAGYASATDRVTVTVDAGAASIRIR